MTMTRLRRRLRLPAVFAVLLLCGCSTNRMLLNQGSGEDWGRRVRSEASIDDRVTVTLRSGVEHDGFITAIGAESLTLRARAYSDEVEPVVVPYGEIVSMKTSSFSLGKTILAVPATLIGTVIVLLILFPPDLSMGQ